MEKISVEEQRKLMTIVAFAEKLKVIQITEGVIDEVRNHLVSQLEALKYPLGEDVTLIVETKKEINEIIYDEIWDDIYDDNVTMLFKNYMKYTQIYDMKKEQIIKSLAESLIEILEKITDLGIRPKKHDIYNDDSSLTEEERQLLKNRATRLILQYKKLKEEGTIKYAKMYCDKLYGMADTEAKFEFINNLFCEITGEYVLDKIRKEREKKEKVAEPESKIETPL